MTNRVLTIEGVHTRGNHCQTPLWVIFSAILSFELGISGFITEVPDSNMVSLISDHQVGDHLELTWTDRRYHSMHCISAAKLVRRVVERSWKARGKLASINYTECWAMSLQNKDKEAVRWMERYHTIVSMDAIITRVTVQYLTC